MDQIQAQLEGLLRSQQRLCEAVTLDYLPAYGFDPRDLGIGDAPGFYPFPSPNVGLTWLLRQKRGEYIPAFLTEPQLSFFRRRIRALVVNSEVALNVINVHNVYGIGTGMTYEVRAKHPRYEPLVEEAQAFADAFVEHNDLCEREPEIVARELIDGEAIIRLFDTGDPVLTCRFVEPEFVRSPDGDETYNSFGVLTAPNDVEDVRGYWVDVGLPGHGSQFELVPPAEVWHLKHHETPATSKRGLSAFYPIETTLRAIEDMVQSTASIVKSRSKIAWLRKIQNATADVANALVAAQTKYTATEPGTNDVINMERYRPGSVLTTNADIEFPSLNIEASDHVAVVSLALRIVAARFSMPEFMIASDASNNNYASILVAESPFVKTMQCFQARHARRLGEKKYGRGQSLIWRQLDHAIRLGYLPPAAKAGLEVVAKGPSLTVSDPVDKAKVDEIYERMRVKSVKTIRTELGLDNDKEEANLAEQGPPPAPLPGVNPIDPTDPRPPAGSPDGRASDGGQGPPPGPDQQKKGSEPGRA